MSKIVQNYVELERGRAIEVGLAGGKFRGQVTFDLSDSKDLAECHNLTLEQAVALRDALDDAVEAVVEAGRWTPSDEQVAAFQAAAPFNVSPSHAVARLRELRDAGLVLP